jgi:hypothetical protein
MNFNFLTLSVMGGEPAVSTTTEVGMDTHMSRVRGGDGSAADGPRPNVLAYRKVLIKVTGVREMKLKTASDFKAGTPVTRWIVGMIEARTPQTRMTQAPVVLVVPAVPGVPAIATAPEDVDEPDDAAGRDGTPEPGAVTEPAGVGAGDGAWARSGGKGAWARGAGSSQAESSTSGHPGRGGHVTT